MLFAALSVSTWKRTQHQHKYLRNWWFLMKKRSKYVGNRVFWKLHFNKYKFKQFSMYYYLKSVCSGFFVPGFLLCHISSLSRKIFRKYLQKNSRFWVSKISMITECNCFVKIAEFFEKLWYYPIRDSIVLLSACIWGLQCYNWYKVFKNGSCKICRRRSLKNCFNRLYIISIF